MRTHIELISHKQMFDDALDLENYYFVEGKRKAFEDVAGKLETSAYEEGWQQGGAIAKELGEYAGFICGYIRCLNVYGKLNQHKDREIKSLDKVLKLIENFPCNNPESDDWENSLTLIRSKMKIWKLNSGFEPLSSFQNDKSISGVNDIDY